MACADESLTRYASLTHAVAVRLEADDTIDVAAPFGLGRVFSFSIQPNLVLPNEGTYRQKALRAKAHWPELSVEPWRSEPESL